MPYNPGISLDNSGLAMGIMRGSASIAAGLEKYAEEKKAMVQNSKYAEGIFKTNPAIQKLIGMTPEEFSLQAGQDKVVKVSSAIASLHQQAQQQALDLKARETEQAIKTARQHELLLAQQARQDAAIGAGINRFGQQMGGQMGGVPGLPSDPEGGASGSPPAAPPGQMPQPMSGASLQPALQQFMTTRDIGGENVPRTLAALHAFMPQPEHDWLPIGATMPAGKGRVAVGKGRGVAVDIAKQEKQFSSLNDPRLYSDDPAVVRKFFESIDDDEERALAIGARKAITSAERAPSLQEELARLMQPGASGAAKPAESTAAKAAAKPKYAKGQRGFIGGKPVIFDGTVWREIPTQ